MLDDETRYLESRVMMIFVQKVFDLDFREIDIWMPSKAERSRRKGNHGGDLTEQYYPCGGISA
jgi:hypothetical protein